MNTSAGLLLSYDVGGSHVSAALVNAADFELRGLASMTVDPSLNADQTMESFAALGRDVLQNCHHPPIAGIAMSVPGPFDYQCGICWIRGLAKHEQLYGVDFRAEMSGRLPGVAPSSVRFINDAAAALLGEIQAGAARGRQRVIGLTLGTGVGSAFSVDGRIVTRGPGVPPEGYVYNLPWKGTTVEEALSSRAIRRMYAERTGEVLDVREIAERSAASPAAAAVMRQFGRTLGEILFPLVQGFRPEVVVLGGAVSRSASLFLPAASEVLCATGVALRPSELPEKAGIIGAAVAWGLG
jgi:glucokinase